MRNKNQKQLPLVIKRIDHPHAEELQRISDILDKNPIINKWVLQDLTRDKKLIVTGAQGMSAEQVLRAPIIKQMEEYSYEELASEKIVSIFEPHTGIIKKDRRDIYYGHKICLSGGASNLITDCMILDGNPADTDLTIKMLDRHKDIYGHYPIKTALDGGFASKENFLSAKTIGITDVCFVKKRGLKEEDMCRSTWVYKRLRRFRAGIESGISWLKRCFGLSKCTWKSHRSFKSYVWASIASANLLTLARSEILANT